MRVWLYTVRLKAKWLGPIVQVFFTSTSNLMFVTSFVVSGSLGFWHFSAPILGSKFVRPKPQKRGGKKSKLGNFSAISATLFPVSWSPHSLISAPAPLSPFSAPLPPYYYENEYFFLVGINIKLFCLIGKIRIGSCKIIRTYAKKITTINTPSSWKKLLTGLNSYFGTKLAKNVAEFKWRPSTEKKHWWKDHNQNLNNELEPRNVGTYRYSIQNDNWE